MHEGRPPRIRRLRPGTPIRIGPNVHNLNRSASEVHRFCALCRGLAGARVEK